MTKRQHLLVLPELGLGARTVSASLWLVEPGADVNAGDRLLEVLAGSVTIDLPSPASGVLVETYVDEDEPLAVGQRLAMIESDDEEEV
ncbi:MAG TPA: lipoyl domain-containing protein [Pirellulales bacterium]|jgi:pyruvate/2-oxoglutarate dehydrogenase complex dihydrolipoamide acyltransferase (E2) component|nr:lipoyl domain-containing protein [Pirellulales bacterium]